MTLSAGSVYALRCGGLAFAFLTIGIGVGRSPSPAAVTLPTLAGFGIAVGLFAFFGDYRARRGRRTTIGPVTRERSVATGSSAGVNILAALGTLAVTRLLNGRPVTLGVLGSLPCIVLFLLSFYDRLAPWPWSESVASKP